MPLIYFAADVAASFMLADTRKAGRFRRHASAFPLDYFRRHVPCLR